MCSMELKWPVCVQPQQKGCPLVQLSLSWLGSVCDTGEALRNRGNWDNYQVWVWIPCKCSLCWTFVMVLVIVCHFCSLATAIFCISCFDDLCQHFLVLKSPKSAKTDCAYVFNKCLSQEFKTINYKKCKEGKSISLLLRPEITKPRNFFQPR